MPPSCVYIVDTNVWIWLVFYYPRDIFPGLWEVIGTMISSGEIVVLEDVYREVRSDVFRQWFDHELHAQQHFLADYDYSNPQGVLPNVLQSCRITNPSGADPILVAAAVEFRESGIEAVVVSQEKASGGTHPLKVPDMCAIFGVRCIKFFDFLREKALQF